MTYPTTDYPLLSFQGVESLSGLLEQGRLDDLPSLLKRFSELSKQARVLLEQFMREQKRMSLAGKRFSDLLLKLSIFRHGDLALGREVDLTIAVLRNPWGFLERV